ncbi:HHL166Wp [Eremothecium sinecaudum]|uniref:HHL166Wp n=1 Tax=Eremothecium sinecaudum TaxID=45286 RepID=A0A0X8HW42_9SACH|nr:HHL166Wp [Eremothecium sinecaudum]AMD22604.1 HHL166Wp [Eremothecium sinecaudum]
MSNAPLNIPGFYFDAEKGKYFKIVTDGASGTPNYSRENLKRKQQEESRRQSEDDYRDRALQARREMVLQILKGRDSGLQHEQLRGIQWLKQSYLGNSLDKANYREYQDVFAGETVGKLSCDMVYDSKKKLFSFFGDRGALYWVKDDGCNFRKTPISLGTGFTLENSRPVINLCTDTILGHLVQTEQACFLCMASSNTTQPKLIKLQLPSRGEIFDSIAFDFADNLKLICLSMASTVHFVILSDTDIGRVELTWFYNLPKAIKSDILSLTGNKKELLGKRCYDIFLGCRNGQICRLMLEVADYKATSPPDLHPLKPISKLFFSFDKPILSMKCISRTNFIAVSIIGYPQQNLCIINATAKSENPVVVQFNTKFQNVFKVTEIFSITGDGKFLLYGTTSAGDGRGDFEIFSTDVQEEVVTDFDKSNLITIVYKLKTMDDCFPNNSLKKLISAALYTSNSVEASDYEVIQPGDDQYPAQVYSHVTGYANAFRHTRAAILCKVNGEVGMSMKSIDIV